MEITFTPVNLPAWTLTDNKIVSNGEEYLLSSFVKLRHIPPHGFNSKGAIQLYNKKGRFTLFAYSSSQKTHAEAAVQYIQSYIDGKITTGTSLSAFVEAEEKGFRKKCNVCGHIFCYTREDLKKNQQLFDSAADSSLISIFNAFGGSLTASAAHSHNADDQLARIVDYDKCPKCGSRNLTDATDEDIERNKEPQGTGVQHVSAADEIKKFKELLDMGIITQEEFDAKKKQLLGL